MELMSSAKWILPVVAGVVFTGCMVPGRVIIDTNPEPRIIVDSPYRVDYRRNHKRAGKNHMRYGKRIKVPPGHLPPPGMCRLWYYDRPPGHQPRPVSCRRIGRRIPYGAAVIRG